MAKTTTNTVLWGLSAFVSLVAGLIVMLSDWQIASTYGYVLGGVIIIIGVLSVAALRGMSLAVMLLGLYFIGRASGAIEHQYLRYGLGIPLVALGIYSFYRLLQHTDPSSSPTITE